MWRNGHFLWALVSVAFITCCGCGEQVKHLNQISKPGWVPKRASWPEYEALSFNSDPDGTCVSKIRRQMEDSSSSAAICDARIGVNNPKFLELVAAFEKTPIPSEFATPEREANKMLLLETIQKLQKGCKSKITEKEQKELFQKADSLLEKIAEIPGQTPPAGSEAARYAPEK